MKKIFIIAIILCVSSVLFAQPYFEFVDVFETYRLFDVGVCDYDNDGILDFFTCNLA